MASVIRIKRSGTSGNPGTLAAGELAYSNLTDNGSNGGDRLYIGFGTETAGNAAEHIVIGGKYFTEKLDHTPGTLTASSALIVDADSKIDNFNVDNLNLNGSTLSTTNTNGDLTLDPNGTGNIVLSATWTTTTDIDARHLWATSVHATGVVYGNTGLSGTILTASQTNITAVGNLTSLSASGTIETTGIVYANSGVSGTILTASQTNITAVGNLTSLSASGPIRTTSVIYGNSGVRGASLGVNGAYVLPTVDGSAGYTILAHGNGVAYWGQAASSLSIAGDSGTDSINLLSDTFTFEGGAGIDTAVTDNKVSFAINTEEMQDLIGAMVSSNTESGISVSYDDTNGKLDFNVNDPVITIAGDADGSATMTNLGDTTISITLDTVNTNVGRYGSSTKVPTFVVNGKGLITSAGNIDIATSLGIAGDTGSDTIDLLSDTLNVVGGEGIDVAVTANTITVSGEDASTSNKGIASFDSGDFDVTAGAVSIKASGVSNAQLENSAVTFGNTQVSLGSSSTTIQGVTQLTVDNIDINGNEIATTNSNGNLSLNPNGSGTVHVNNSRIAGLAAPVESSDAATKAYVDAVKTGLDPKDSVRAATTENITLSGTQTIDGIALSIGNRVLVKNQSTASENGIYVVASSTWSRSTDADEDAEITSGLFVFVEEGDTNADSGWVLSTNGTITVGSTSLSFVQFSGAGQITAGAALTKTGNQLDVQVAASGGIEISSDALQLKSGVAGAGLTYTSGVIDVVGTADRISVSSNSIDIAATYVGQTSITTLGTITAGTWTATTIGTAYGGTGQTSYSAGDLLRGTSGGSLSKLALGSAGKVLQVNAAGNDIEYADLDGGTY